MTPRTRHLLVVLLGIAASMAPARAQTESRPGWLGVMLAPVEAEQPTRGVLDAGLDETATRAPFVRISAIVRDSPADRAGLRASDQILRVGGVPVDSPASVIAAVQAHEAGHAIELAIVRRGEERTVSVRLGDAPQQRSRMPLKRGVIGIEPLDVPVGLREYWGGGDERGVLIGDVDDGGAAWRAGVRPGDLVLAVDGVDVAEVRMLGRLVAEGGIGNELVFELSRQGAFLTVEIEIEEAREDDRDGE